METILLMGTFYFMPHWMFVGFLMISMFTVMTLSYMYMDVKGSLEVFSWSNVGALILTGVPAFANMYYKHVRPLHLICATLGFVIISLGFWLDYDMLYWTITMFSIALTTFFITKKYFSCTWWVEHSLIISMLIGYGILIINC